MLQIVYIEADDEPSNKGFVSISPADVIREKNQLKVFQRMLDFGIIPHVIPKLPKTLLHVIWFDISPN